jgi:hypothetical protein
MRRPRINRSAAHAPIPSKPCAQDGDDSVSVFNVHVGQRIYDAHCEILQRFRAVASAIPALVVGVGVAAIAATAAKNEAGMCAMSEGGHGLITPVPTALMWVV